MLNISYLGLRCGESPPVIFLLQLVIRDFNSSAQTIATECHLIYNYLRHRAADLPPPELVREFQHLFGQGKNENRRVTQALAKIVADKEQFERFLSDCCYIIFDCWANLGLEFYSQLLDTLDTAGVKSHDRRRQKLFKLIDLYRQSESYLQLKAVATIISPQKIASNSIPHRQLTKLQMVATVNIALRSQLIYPVIPISIPIFYPNSNCPV